MLSDTRNSHSFVIIALLFLCLFGYSYNTFSQDLDSLVSSLNESSLPIVQLEFNEDSINRLSYTSGIITIHDVTNLDGGAILVIVSYEYAVKALLIMTKSVMQLNWLMPMEMTLTKTYLV